MGATGAAGALAREHGCEPGIVGQKDWGSGLRRNPGVHKRAERRIEVAHDGNMQLKEIVRALVVADECGDLGRGDFRLGKEGIGIELHRDAIQDTAKYPLGRRMPIRSGPLIGKLKFVVDILAVLEQTLLVARDEGIFVGSLAGAFGDAYRSRCSRIRHGFLVVELSLRLRLSAARPGCA